MFSCVYVAVVGGGFGPPFNHVLLHRILPLWRGAAEIEILFAIERVTAIK